MLFYEFVCVANKLIDWLINIFTKSELSEIVLRPSVLARAGRTDGPTDGRKDEVQCVMRPLAGGPYKLIQESSAKLTNQRVSYAFTSSLFSFHARPILPTSKFQLFLYFTYFLQTSEQHVWELWVWIQFTGLTIPLRVTPMNNPIYHQYSRWVTFLLPLKDWSHVK